MFSDSQLDQAAANRNKRQQLDHLLRISAPHERVILAGIGLAFLALVVWVSFGSIARSVVLEGVLLKPGVRHEIVSAELGHLVKFMVDPGDQVEEGDPIARQTVPELDREVVALRDQIEILEAGIRQVGGDGTHSLLASAQEALLQMESRRAAKEVIVSHMSGEVMALRVAPGDYLPAGSAVAQLRNQGNQTLQAVLQVGSRIAKRLQPGMQASVEFMMPDGTMRETDGAVASITSGPLPHWLAAFRPEDMNAVHRVDIAFDPSTNQQGPAVPDGTPCRVRIMLGQHSLIALLDPEQI